MGYLGEGRTVRQVLVSPAIWPDTVFVTVAELGQKAAPGTIYELSDGATVMVTATGQLHPVSQAEIRARSALAWPSSGPMPEPATASKVQQPSLEIVGIPADYTGPPEGVIHEIALPAPLPIESPPVEKSRVPPPTETGKIIAPSETAETKTAGGTNLLPIIVIAAVGLWLLKGGR